MLQKKGQVSFNLASTIVFSLVGFLLVVIVGLLIWNAIDGGALFTGTRPTYTITNETNSVAQGYFINGTGITLAQVNATTSGYVITQAWNQSGSGSVIPATNYSVSSLGVVKNTSNIIAGNNWTNVSISYTYQDLSTEEYLTSSIKSNMTSGVNTISTNIGTVFTVISILIVLGVIVLLVVIVRKFGFGSSSFGQ